MLYISLTILIYFSPSGKLVQIEYALAAVAAGAPAVGIKAKDGVVLATEKKHKSILVEEHSIIKVEMITDHIGMVYSGNYNNFSFYIYAFIYLHIFIYANRE